MSKPADQMQIRRDIGELPELAYLDVAAIRVDENYQRPIKPRRVAQILREFTWAQFGALMVVDQGDGTFTVYDGQHRLAAAKAHPDVEAIPAIIVRLEAAREEAEHFLGVNINRSSISTVEKYWAGIEAGDEGMMRICAVLEDAGCEVVPAGTKSFAPGRTSSISALERALKSNGDEAVTLALQTLREAWPSDPNALGGVLIQALSRLYRANKAAMSFDHMVQRLRGKDRRILAADAEAMKKISGGDAVLSLTKTLLEIYNRGLSKNMIQLGTR